MSTSASPWIVAVNQADFERDVIERSRQLPVVVDFWAPWCGPCRALTPLLEQVVAERKGEVLLAKINIDEAPDLAARYFVQAIPAVKAFRDGKVVLEFEGVLPEGQLRDFFNRISPSEADRFAREAVTLEATNPSQAEKLYRQATAQDPRHEAALIGLARVLLARGCEDEADELLSSTGFGDEHAAEAERLQATVFLKRHARSLGSDTEILARHAADPKSAERNYQLGCILAAAGKYEEALQSLLAAAESDPKLATSKIREVMVKIFYAIGVRSPMADEYRDKLSRILY